MKLIGYKTQPSLSPSILKVEKSVKIYYTMLKHVLSMTN